MVEIQAQDLAIYCGYKEQGSLRIKKDIISQKHKSAKNENRQNIWKIVRWSIFLTVSYLSRFDLIQFEFLCQMLEFDLPIQDGIFPVL